MDININNPKKGKVFKLLGIICIGSSIVIFLGKTFGGDIVYELRLTSNTYLFFGGVVLWLIGELIHWMYND